MTKYMPLVISAIGPNRRSAAVQRDARNGRGNDTARASRGSRHVERIFTEDLNDSTHAAHGIQANLSDSDLRPGSLALTAS
jgi:hypothetical protein